jgi:hypothetical protein
MPLPDSAAAVAAKLRRNPGNVAKPAAEKAVGFVMGLLAGDAKGATKGITKDDFISV